MKKKCIIITFVTFVVLAALTFSLPQEIPLHFGVSGSGSVVNKYFILLFCLSTFASAALLSCRGSISVSRKPRNISVYR